MLQHKLDLDKYAEIARRAAAESCVVLKNDNQALPFRKGDKIAVFGRCAYYYYKSGLGSGGMVNTRYVVSIMDALKACDMITLEQRLQDIYELWIKNNPVNEGNGWGNVPWSQKEMPLTDEIIKTAKAADAALVIIGRTAGEDQDNKAEEGSFLLTETERDMIKKVSSEFERTIVLLNVGNIIDMSWVDECNPAAVLYAWQGGQEGGNGAVDVLTGKVNPCGKLTDTIAEKISDYPSTANFGDLKKNYYKEDIYVGYRYFETFAKEKVKYPFGYGLSYTQFDISAELSLVTVDKVSIAVKVTNTGKTAGKEVVQVYVQAPQGKLGKPSRVLAGFKKTKLLAPGETQEIEIICPKSAYASFDDSGITEYRNCFLLESGQYSVYAGADVRSAHLCGCYEQGIQLIEQLEEACAPVESFKRYKAVERENGELAVELEDVPLRTVDIEDRISSPRKKEIPYTGDKGYLLQDVWEGNISLDDFIGQLTDFDLMCIFHGEGMCSPRVTPGTAAAFGGVTDSLVKKGIPAACCADGPSGIRMDCGTKAFLIPNGTALGCTFNLELVEELFKMVGEELFKNKIDSLLGPGINIHRNPLNGRNFEYFSEDPLLTGRMCAAQLHGMHASGTTGTIKHFCANNQEQNRYSVDAVVSQRALREIYLKVFEIAVKEGNAKSVMTSYGPLNGRWTSSSYDLCTTILREQWKYKGIVMTDWWAAGNWEGKDESKTDRAPMIIAQNDLYMCCDDAEGEMGQDDVREMFEKGIIKRSDFQRNARNILRFILDSPAMLRLMGKIQSDSREDDQEDEADVSNIKFYKCNEAGSIVITPEDEDFSKDEILFGIIINGDAEYKLSIEASSELAELAQLPVAVYRSNMYQGMVTFQGTQGKTAEKKCSLGYAMGRNHYIKVKKCVKGLEILKLTVYRD